MNLHASLHSLRLLGMLRLRCSGRCLNELKYPSCTGQGILQLRNHTGNLIKGFGILVGIVENTGQAAHGDPACNRDQSAGECNPRVDHGINKSGAGIHQR